MNKPSLKLPYTSEMRPTCTPIVLPMGLSVLSDLSTYILTGINDGLPIIDLEDLDDLDEDDLLD